MSITAKSLREKFEKDLADLQNSCSHSDVSDWMDEWWAPAHSTGRRVKCCNICEKIVEADPDKPYPYIIETKNNSEE